jgi:hypothetical protein
LEGVEPLFNVPACVLFARKPLFAEGEGMAKPGEDEGIHGYVLYGRLLRRNASLSEAEERLHIDDVQFSLNRRGKRSFWATELRPSLTEASYYKKKFRKRSRHLSSFLLVRGDHSVPSRL